MEDIYSYEFLKTLFNEMSSSYDRVNYITSFGFSSRFRRDFIRHAKLEPGHAVCDLMCGQGECWPFILDKIHNGSLVALDLSPGMLDGARVRLSKLPGRSVDVVEGNALATELADASMDRVLIAFGIKTLAPELYEGLAAEMFRILRPGGLVSLVEISDPKGWGLRPLYMWYLKSIIPVLGKVLLGNPHNYRMLGVYTERFQGFSPVIDVMRNAGFDTHPTSFFHGCATGIVAHKPVGAAFRQRDHNANEPTNVSR